MLKFKRRNQWPPGGKFFYEVPETKNFFDSLTSRLDLLQQVRAHYDANKLPIPVDLEARIEDHICRNVPDGFCYGETEGVLALTRNLTFWQIERKSRGILQKAAFTEQHDAENRVAKCLSCTYNLRHICTTCNGLRATVRALTGGRATPADSFLGVCALTGCIITAMAFRLDATFDMEVCPPAFCWAKKKA